MHPIAVQMRITPSVFPSEGAVAAMIARGSIVVVPFVADIFAQREHQETVGIRAQECTRESKTRVRPNLKARVCLEINENVLPQNAANGNQCGECKRKKGRRKETAGKAEKAERASFSHAGRSIHMSCSCSSSDDAPRSIMD